MHWYGIWLRIPAYRCAQIDRHLAADICTREIELHGFLIELQIADTGSDSFHGCGAAIAQRSVCLDHGLGKLRILSDKSRQGLRDLILDGLFFSSALESCLLLCDFPHSLINPVHITPFLSFSRWAPGPGASGGRRWLSGRAPFPGKSVRRSFPRRRAAGRSPAAPARSPGSSA